MIEMQNINPPSDGDETMAKTIREQIEEKIKNQKAENNSPIRKIRCDQCNWSMGRRRRNAWGDTSYLRGQLAKHLAEAHPTN
tara:strand:+ start:590 stop:835 length:246 start_codon:yes stop_codon:yes gene_type:complete